MTPNLTSTSQPPFSQRRCIYRTCRQGRTLRCQALLQYVQQVKELFGDTAGDPGHWNFSPEWFGSQGGGWGRDGGSVEFYGQSECGNGTVTVTSHPATPWMNTSVDQLQEQQWRVLRFNADTRQSVNRVCVRADVPSSSSSHITILPQCLAWPYLRVMAAAAAAVLHQSPAVFTAARRPRTTPTTTTTTSPSSSLNSPPLIVCVGLGGGTLPAFLSHHFPGACVVAVELDPLVVQAARAAMGLGEGMADNLSIVEGDAAVYLEQLARTSPGSVDLLVIDAFDGQDRVPPQLCDAGAPFLRHTATALHPKHGAVLMNLHAEGTGNMGLGERLGVMSGRAVDSGYDPSAPQGRQIQRVGAAYSAAVLGADSGARGAAFTVADRYGGGNITAVVARGLSTSPRGVKAAQAQLQAAAVAGGQDAGFAFDCARYVHKFAPL